MERNLKGKEKGTAVPGCVKNYGAMHKLPRTGELKPTERCRSCPVQVRHLAAGHSVPHVVRGPGPRPFTSAVGAKQAAFGSQPAAVSPGCKALSWGSAPSAPSPKFPLSREPEFDPPLVHF